MFKNWPLKFVQLLSMTKKFYYVAIRLPTSFVQFPGAKSTPKISSLRRSMAWRSPNCRVTIWWRWGSNSGPLSKSTWPSPLWSGTDLLVQFLRTFLFPNFFVILPRIILWRLIKAVGSHFSVSWLVKLP